jgi:hypothetical protein
LTGNSQHWIKKKILSGYGNFFDKKLPNLSKEKLQVSSCLLISAKFRHISQISDEIQARTPEPSYDIDATVIIQGQLAYF